MNRLEATVVDGGRGSVRYAGVEVDVEAARGRPSGDRVLVLVRPESMSVDALPDGEVPKGALPGRVIAQVFLGSVTRLKVETSEPAALSVDVPSSKARPFVAGTRIAARFSPDSARVLDLAGS